MASIVEQGKSVHARIVRKGYPVQTNTFPIKTLAKAWAGRIEPIKWTAERGSIDVLDLHHSAMRGISIIE